MILTKELIDSLWDEYRQWALKNLHCGNPSANLGAHYFLARLEEKLNKEIEDGVKI